MKLAKIGISGAYLPNTTGAFEGYNISYANEVYIKSVQEAGGLPFILPLISKEYAKDFMQTMDALILTGGADLENASYGCTTPHPKQRPHLPRRDAFDLALVQAARDLQKPILAICRGLWVLNVALGGTLYPHLEACGKNLAFHWQKQNPSKPHHEVEICKDSFLEEIYGKSLLVNSIHSACIANLASGLKIAAKSPDGVIEAVQGEQMYGLQWHPECLEGGAKIFEFFINSLKKE